MLSGQHLFHPAYRRNLLGDSPEEHQLSVIFGRLGTPSEAVIKRILEPIDSYRFVRSFVRYDFGAS